LPDAYAVLPLSVYLSGFSALSLQVWHLVTTFLNYYWLIEKKLYLIYHWVKRISENNVLLYTTDNNIIYSGG